MKKVTAIVLTAVLGSVAAQTTIGSFRLVGGADRASGQDRSFVATAAVGGLYGSISQLYFSCNGPKFGIFVDTARPMSVGTVPVAYRFDTGQAALSRDWPVPVAGRVAFVPPSLVKTFAQQALAAKQVVVRVTGPDGPPRNYTFRLGSLRQALGRLQCARSLV